MSQAYSNPAREAEPTALPDIEILHSSDLADYETDDGETLSEGWYWWSCLPGCLPDSEPRGPFGTYEDALADAQEGVGEEE